MDKLVCNKFKRQTVTYIMKLWGLVLASAMNIYTCLDSHSKQKNMYFLTFHAKALRLEFQFPTCERAYSPYEITNALKTIDNQLKFFINDHLLFLIRSAHEKCDV
jgi:hypothetical protein